MLSSKLLALIGLAISLQAETANLIVYRNYAYRGAWRKLSVELDGQKLATLKNTSYIKVSIPLGKHTLTGKQPEDVFRFEAATPATIYIRCEFQGVSSTKAGIRFSAIDEPTAVGDIGKLKLTSR